MDIQFELAQAKAAIQENDPSKARSILRKVLEQEPRNVNAWLLFAEAAQKPEHSVECLERVLILEPGNTTAAMRLEQIRSRPPVESLLNQESGSAPPVSVPVSSTTLKPSVPTQSRELTTNASHSSARPKKTVSNTEKILYAILAILALSVLCVLGYTLLSGPLSGLISNQPSPTPTDYSVVIYENIRASNAEDKQAYMATIHPDSPAYKTTEDSLDTIFDTFDLSYRVSGVSVIEENSREVKLTFTLVTRKIRGPDFRDNQVDGVMILRKDGDVWKIYNQTVDNIKYLN
jgi:hypothetical protein